MNEPDEKIPEGEFRLQIVCTERPDGSFDTNIARSANVTEVLLPSLLFAAMGVAMSHLTAAYVQQKGALEKLVAEKNAKRIVTPGEILPANFKGRHQPN